MKFKRHATVDDLLSDALHESGNAIDAMNRMFEEDAVSRQLLLLRTKAGVSQEEMARRLNLTQNDIARMEDEGRALSDSDIIRYVRALKNSATSLAVERDAPLAVLK